MAPPVFRRLRGLALTEVQRLQDHVGDTLDAVRVLLNNGLTFASNFAAQVLTLTIAQPADVVAVGSFSNGWINNGGTVAASYRKGADGYVDLDGVIKNGTIGLAAFTLPAAYAPAALLIRPAASNNAGTSTYGELRIQSDGSVVPFAGSNTFFSVAARFPAADRTPPAQGSPFPLTVVLDRGFAGTPTHIWVTRAVESTGLLVPNVRLDWSPATVGGLTAVQINAAHGLAPLRTYTVTAVVTSG